MQTYIKRQKESLVLNDLKNFPAVAITGPRQCGKSTMVKKIGKNIKNFLYLDLELPSDLRKLDDPELFFRSNQDKVICLDEIQRKPELFAVLRGIIDQNRKNGRFLLLGSASRKLIQEGSESLAGRISFIELTPFTYSEINKQNKFNLNDYWLKGSYPLSFLPDNAISSRWRQNYISALIERDIPQLGIKIPSTNLRRFLSICAHVHGQLVNRHKISQSLGLSYNTVQNYIDVLSQTYIFRVLPPLETNLKKRLIKSPKLYFRDSGILHSILEINDFNSLLGHPVLGASWEGLAINTILSELSDWHGYFYRTSTGNEIDLIITRGQERVALEFKASTSPLVSKGFWIALNDLKISEAWVISPINDHYLLKEKIYVSGIEYFLKEIKNK